MSPVVVRAHRLMEGSDDSDPGMIPLPLLSGQLPVDAYAYIDHMHGLVLRLSALDADAASGLRVIGFFDTFMEQQMDLSAVLRATAQLVEAPVGIRTADRMLCQRVAPDGRVTADGPRPDSRIHELSTGDEIWLERTSDPLPLDDLVMERFALVAAVALARRDHDLTHLDVSGLVQQAVRSSLSEFDRHQVAVHLGFDPDAPMHVLAVAGEPASLRDLVTSWERNAQRVRHGRVGSHFAVLSSHPVTDEVAVPVGCRCGSALAGGVADLPTAWQRARTALRFAQPSTHPPPYSKQEAILVAFEQLGGFAAVAHHVPVEAINQIEDVRVLDQLAAEPGGDDMIRTLEAVAATESLRSAAKILHLHHNSVAHRVAKAEQVLGFVIAESYSHSRLMLALVLQRLRDSHPVD